MMNEKYHGYIKSPIGWLEIICSKDALLSVKFTLQKGKELKNSLVEEVIQQLEEYFRGERTKFDIKLELSGSEFRKKAWNALLQIPFGETISYKEQAAKIGNPNAARAIGGANNKNPIAIIVPCHRVIGKNGDMTGYNSGIEKKIFLLNHEQKVKNSIPR